MVEDVGAPIGKVVGPAGHDHPDHGQSQGHGAQPGDQRAGSLAVAAGEQRRQGDAEQRQGDQRVTKRRRPAAVPLAAGRHRHQVGESEDSEVQGQRRAAGHQECQRRQHQQPDRREPEQSESAVVEQPEAAAEIVHQRVAVGIDLLPAVDLQRVRVHPLVVEQDAAGERQQQRAERQRLPALPRAPPCPPGREGRQRRRDQDEADLEQRQQQRRHGNGQPGAPARVRGVRRVRRVRRVELEDPVERRHRQQRRGHLDPDLVGVQEQRRRESHPGPGDQRLSRPLRGIVPAEPQRQPGQGGGQQGHGQLGAGLAGQAVGGRENQGQQRVVAGVLLATRPRRIARLRRDRAVHEMAPVPGGVVVRQVRVAVVGQAVGEQQIVGLVAIRLALARRPRQDGEIDGERQPEEQRRRAAPEAPAEQRPQRRQLARQAMSQEQQQARGQHLAGMLQPQRRPREDRREQRPERGKLAGAARP